MIRQRLARVMPIVLGAVAMVPAATQSTAVRAVAPDPITFAVPAVTDPIHAYGEPDIGIDNRGRVFVSGPMGTGVQRSGWFGSVDGGQTYRAVQQQAVPSTGVVGTASSPGGGDTEIVFDNHTGNGQPGMYFSDLYALLCFRVEASHDGGASTSSNSVPTTAGCAGDRPTADRQWQAVYDPPAGVATTSLYGLAHPGQPLIYLTYNGGGANWTKSTDGVNYTPADGGTLQTPKHHFGNDGYPAIDQVTGKVFEAAGSSGNTIKLNIGTPDASGNLAFLDDTGGGGLVTIASGLLGSPDAHFPVVTMDGARNLIASWNISANNLADDQVWVAASPARGPNELTDKWDTWTTPFKVSDGLISTGDAVNSFSWGATGGTAGIADVAWYGGDKLIDPNTISGQVWNVFMNQVQFQHDPSGVITGPPVSLSNGPLKVTPHPMHYNDICGAGTGCIAQQGNRNLADFFEIKTDASGAAEIVYDDTSNGLLQVGAPPSQQTADHAGAPVVTVIRQNGGLGVLGTPVNPSNTVSVVPTDHLQDGAGDALYPVIGGTNVPGMDLRQSKLALSGNTLTVTMQVADLTNPAGTSQSLSGASVLSYVTSWVMQTPGDTQHPYTIFYAEMTGNSTVNDFSAGPAASTDLCSVSACFPHDILYPESPPAAPGSPVNGASEPGTVSCPGGGAPCTITINVKTSDVGSPTNGSLLEEVGTYALAGSHPQASTTMAQGQADNVPLEIDGICCYNYQASINATVPEFPTSVLPVAVGLVAVLAVGPIRGRLARRRRREVVGRRTQHDPTNSRIEPFQSPNRP